MKLLKSPMFINITEIIGSHKIRIWVAVDRIIKIVDFGEAHEDQARSALWLDGVEDSIRVKEACSEIMELVKQSKKIFDSGISSF
jgi:hypothetical protein